MFVFESVLSHGSRSVRGSKAIQVQRDTSIFFVLLKTTFKFDDTAGS